MNFRFETKTKKLAGICLILLLAMGNLAFAQTTEEKVVQDLNSQKSETQKKLDIINAQIKNYSQQINDARGKANTLKGEISIYEKEIASTELQIEARQTQITDTQSQIDALKKLIEQKLKEIGENKKILSELIRQLNEFDNEYFLKTTVGAQNFSEFFDQIQYTSNYGDKVYQIVQKIKELKTRLEAQQKDLEIQLANLEELKNQLEETRASLDLQREQKQKLLTQTRGIESNYQKLLTASKTEEDKLQKEIEDLDAAIRAKLGNKTIPAAKGVLAWPMDGILTQKYGNTGFTSLGYSFHNGIDIAAPAGQPVYAAADGEVIATDRSDASYGNWVGIKHNISTKGGSAGIITVYGHFRTIKVKEGQKVKQGDLIGYEGNSGNTTKKLYGPERGYHVHFTVYDEEGFGIANGAYTKTYGPYRVPYGYTYNPISFLE
jgi:murein DD-endopeptidase MepM/ murein hydrolase activator NlpD